MELKVGDKIRRRYQAGRISKVCWEIYAINEKDIRLKRKDKNNYKTLMIDKKGINNWSKEC